ncbi:MAG: class I SAM-dependent methyltransferase [Acidobacteriia bacterium]|nr:class I SAM-dependent methyltransferase [Terriglobia bacterium]
MSLRSTVWRALASRYPSLYWLRRGRTYYQQREESACERLMHEAVLDRIAALKPSRLLEYGAGNGSFLRKIQARMPDVECFGVDFSASQLAVARAAMPGANLSVGNLTHLKFETGAFDVVVGLGVLIYVRPQDRRRVFGELRRVCRGHLVAVEYITKFFDAGMKARFDGARDFRYDYDIEQHVRDAGFDVLDAGKIAAAWDPATNPLGELPHGMIVARAR